MMFCADHRDTVAGELGSGAAANVSKVLGERWAAQEDREKWERQAAKDKARHESEMAAYNQALEEERAAAAAAAEAAAAGPSEREEERAKKRQLMQEQAAEREAKPKAPKKQRELTATEKSLAAQNKAIEADKSKAAKSRLHFLLGKSEVFKHFGLLKEGEKPKKKGRKTEKEEDDEMMAEAPKEEGALEEKVRVTAQPALINAEFGNMRAYQVAGLNWLANLYQNGINGILADEMGLGKTLQSISLLAWLREAQGLEGPFLVLAPKSTLNNWAREFANWAPVFNVLLFHGDKEKRQQMIDVEMQPGKFDVIVTSYEMVIREQGAFRKFAWRYLIVDEAHRMKNEESKLAQVLRSLSTHSRLLITGTPLQNNLHELWALLNFLLPDVFNSSDDFDSWFDLDDKKVEQEVISQLHKLLKPFMLRRIKTDVEGSIPPKQELLVYTHLSPMQREQYKNILKRDMDALYQSSGAALTANKSRLMNIVMQLRKCCNHPYLFEGVEDKSLPPFGDHLVTNCGKMRVLDKLLLRCKQQGSRVLIFSQMTRVLDILEDYCAYRHDEGFSYCRIDGSTGGDDRQDSIDAFNATDSTVFLFLLSTRAGGLGINLQTADVVVLFDSDWNPQADLQAQDRAHRIGQKKEVKVFRFVTVDSIEEKVLERAERKLQMDYAVVQQGRLAEKAKGVSKEEALAAVRYGADKQFRMAADKDITDEEIDVLLATTKNLTAEREALLKDKEKKDLLDFSNAEVNFQEFDGVDYKALQSHGDMEFMSEMQDAMGKRERAAGSYNERDYQRVPAAAPVEKGMPKAKKLPDYKEHQFFNVKRIIELYELQHKRETSKARQIQRLMETGGEAAEAELAKVQEAGETEEEKAQRTELEGLEAEGFLSWSKNDYSKFLKECERSGRDEFAKIAEQVATKSVDEVKAYAAAFWGGKGAQHIGDFEKQVKKIEDGEKKMKEKEMMSKDLKAKVSSTPNPWINLQIKYGNNRGKLFTESEDRFLLCMTDQLGYGMWEDLKREVRRSPEFRFDWLFKSRTPAELGRRCDLLIRLIQTEAGSGPAKSRGPKKGEAAGSGAMEVDA